MLTTQNAQNALVAHANANANNTTISANTIANLLSTQANTFANILFVTQVNTSAKYKHVKIQKVTQANVQLFNTTFNYVKAVQKSANNISANNNDVNNFVAQSNYYTHTNCFSIVQHKTNNCLYLYASFNNAKSLYFINNVLATKQQVAQYLTASKAKQLLEPNNVVYNVTNNVMHTLQLRTVMLTNLVSITTNKQTITV